MRCPNPHCRNGYVQIPVPVAEADSVSAALMRAGYTLLQFEVCPDCGGTSVAHYCEGMTAANDDDCDAIA